MNKKLQIIINRHFKCVCILTELSIKKTINVAQYERAIIGCANYTLDIIVKLGNKC